MTSNHARLHIILLASLALATLFIALVPVPYGYGAAAASIWLGVGAIPRVIAGKDGAWSSSKFQLYLWTGTIAYCLVTAVACRRMLAGGPPPALPLPFPDVPSWMWAALGLSGGTTLAAKGIVVGYVANGRLQESKTSDSGPAGWLGLICDDNGRPSISKLQLLFWTVAACLYATVEATALIKVTVTSPTPLPAIPLPDLPLAVLVLCGLGQGVYLGGKLLDSELPQITGVDRSTVVPGGCVRLYGSRFGATFEGQRITLGGIGLPIVTEEWSDSAATVTIPMLWQGQPWPMSGTTLQLRVWVREVASGNETTLTIQPASEPA